MKPIRKSSETVPGSSVTTSEDSIGAGIDLAPIFNITKKPSDLRKTRGLLSS
jgi:hypothetical protein